jgi:hypothetical protein
MKAFFAVKADFCREGGMAERKFLFQNSDEYSTFIFPEPFRSFRFPGYLSSNSAIVLFIDYSQ